MSQYNTLVAQIDHVEENRNGTITLSGEVEQAIGPNYERGDRVVATVSKATAEFVADKGEGTYLLERVNPDDNSCGFATFTKGNPAKKTLVGPLQISWQDDQEKTHFVTFDENGIENQMDDVKKALRRHAGTMRVSRDLIELEDDGKPSSHVMAADQVDRRALSIIEDYPSATAFLMRDGDHAIMARLRWDDENKTRYFEWPTNREGNPVQFDGDVEIVPVVRMDYLRNSFDPKKSTAYSVVNNMLNKSDRQLAYEAKLYPSWDSFATGIVIARELPKGGSTIEQVAVSFPTMRKGEVPGEMQMEKPRNAQESGMSNVKEFLRAFAKEMGIDSGRVEGFLSTMDQGKKADGRKPEAESGSRRTASARNEQGGQPRSSAGRNPAGAGQSGNPGGAAGNRAAPESAAPEQRSDPAQRPDDRTKPPAARPAFGARRKM